MVNLPLKSAVAVLNNSRLLNDLAAETIFSAVSCRAITEFISASYCSRVLGSSSSKFPNIETASGALINKSVAYLLEERSLAINSAAADSSLNNLKNQGVLPRASLNLLNESKAISGSGPSANQESKTGNKVF